MTKVEKLVAALVGPAQDLQNALQQLLLLRAIDTATGVQMDILGDIVGQKRLGLSDADYRRYLRARVATNRSGGVFEDIIKIAVLIINDVATKVDAETRGTATALVQLLNNATTAALAATVFLFLNEAKSAGVRLVLEWSESAPANTFKFDIGPGWDQGHLAGALG